MLHKESWIVETAEKSARTAQKGTNKEHDFFFLAIDAVKQKRNDRDEPALSVCVDGVGVFVLVCLGLDVSVDGVKRFLRRS